MPTYDYVCAACGHELELFQNITEAPKRKCPACKKNRLERKIGGGAGFLFKGSGFYLTDYRSDSYKKAADADARPTESKSTESKAAEAKPSEAATSKSASADQGKAEQKKAEPKQGDAPHSAPSSKPKKHK